FRGRWGGPGRGRRATPSSAADRVLGMQKLVPRVDACGWPSLRSPAGEPVWVIASTVAWPKAPEKPNGLPAADCPGQKFPSAAVTVVVPVVSGVRFTGSVATTTAAVGMQHTLLMPP